ncbi:MAG: DUF4190 domain-containing protein [Salinibacterium sp.]|nr:DUF4190 domain-containing protein [Salinibacterium sp.]
MTEPTPTPYTAPAAAPARPTNTLSIIALVGAFVIPLAGIIVGFIALGQIKKTGEGGHGLALAGVVLGIVFSVLWLLFIAMSVLIPLLFAANYRYY